MECAGFEIRSGYLLAYSGQELDLHNDFDVTGIVHEPSTATLSVTLRRRDEASVSRTVPQEIVVRFEQVSRLLRRAGNPALAADQRVIRFIGFLYPDNETMDGFLDAMTDSSQDLIVQMEDNSAFKVHAARVALEVHA